MYQLKEGFGRISQKGKRWNETVSKLKCYVRSLLSTGICVIRVFCGLWPARTEMSNFCFFVCNRFRRNAIGLSHVRLFVRQKSAPRISREPFDLELSNVIRTSIPTYSTATPDMTSLTTSGCKLLREKKLPKIRPPTAVVEFLENGLSKDN